MEDTNSLSTQKILTGCVKWFNNNLNYGFITVLTEGEHLNVDVFSHQSNIKTKNNCFRTLYTGECVQFELAKSDNDKHPFHAINISGFNGGLLHCENPNYRSMKPVTSRDGSRDSRQNSSTSRGRGSSNGYQGNSSRGRGSSNGYQGTNSRSASKNSTEATNIA